MLGSWGRVALATIATGLALASCTTEATPPPATTGSPPPSAQTRVEHPKADVPKDRDEQAVIAALRQLDACVLVDPAAIGAPAGAKPVASGPRRCWIPLDGTGHGVYVVFGVEWDPDVKFLAEPVELDGANAYLLPDGSGESACQVVIPVSFELAVAVAVTGNGGACATTKSVATVVAGRLAKPDLIAAPADPWTSWDACALLAAGLGDHAAVVNLRSFGDWRTGGLDDCNAKKSSPPHESYRLTLEYADAKIGSTGVKTLGGKQVAVSADGGDWCTLRWREGRVGFPNDRPDRMIHLSTSDCPRGDQLAVAVMKLLPTPPPDRVAPQRPLVYRPDEPDVPAAGACVDFRPHGLCQPHDEVPVPRDAKVILDAAARDHHVACAMVVDAVRRRFGQTMQPVVSVEAERSGCHFVEPTHTLIVRISVLPAQDIREFDPYKRSNAQILTVADRPAVLTTGLNKGYESSSLCLSPVRDATSGVLCVHALFLPGRGAARRAQVDDSRKSLLEPTAADLVAQHFS